MRGEREFQSGPFNKLLNGPNELLEHHLDTVTRYPPGSQKFLLGGGVRVLRGSGTPINLVVRTRHVFRGPTVDWISVVVEITRLPFNCIRESVETQTFSPL